LHRAPDVGKLFKCGQEATRAYQKDPGSTMNAKDFLRLSVPLGEATRPPSLRYGATSGILILERLTL